MKPNELPERLTVAVTQAHIDAGRRNSCGGCPIALAMKEIYPLAYGYCWDVDSDALRIELGGVGITIAELPESAQDFIADFDAGRPVAPFTFEAVRRLDGEVR